MNNILFCYPHCIANFYERKLIKCDTNRYSIVVVKIRLNFPLHKKLRDAVALSKQEHFTEYSLPFWSNARLRVCLQNEALLKLQKSLSGIFQRFSKSELFLDLILVESVCEIIKGTETVRHDCG